MAAGFFGKLWGKIKGAASTVGNGIKSLVGMDDSPQVPELKTAEPTQQQQQQEQQQQQQQGVTFQDLLNQQAKFFASNNDPGT